MITHNSFDGIQLPDNLWTSKVDPYKDHVVSKRVSRYVCNQYTTWAGYRKYEMLDLYIKLMLKDK